MATNTRSTLGSKNGAGATSLIVHAEAPVAGNGAAKAILTGTVPAASSAASTAASVAASVAATSAGAASSPTGGVLASLGVTNTGFTQVKVKNLATAAFQKKLSARLNGLQKYLPATTNLTVNNQTFSVATIISILQAILALFADKATAQEQAKGLVGAAAAALNSELPIASQFLAGLDGTLAGMLGKGNPMLENFGLSKGTAKTPSTLEKAEAVATSKNTRTERKTMGKVQKAGVKGAPATLVLAGSAAAAASAPAPSSTPAPGSGGSSTGSTSGQ